MGIQIFNNASTDEGSYWFKRLVNDCKKISPYIRIKRIKLGFFRIYWRDAYIHEIYKEMPQTGYDVEENDYRYESKKFYESKEDRAELTRKIKNYVEGYWESLDVIRTRVYMFRHNKEMYENARRGYSQTVVK